MNRVTTKPLPFIEPRGQPSGPLRPETAHYLNRRFFDFQRELAYPHSRRPEVWAAWRKRLRHALGQTLQLQALGPVPTPRWKTLSVTQTRHYTRRKIAYETLPGNWVTAYLLLPSAAIQRTKRTAGTARTSGKTDPGSALAPAVICPHGHVKGGKAGVVFPAKALGKAYGHELACRGAVVLAPDNAGMGERDRTRGNALPGIGGCMLVWNRLNHMGLDLTGLRVFELMAGVNLLSALPGIDPNRIGAAGLSGGCWLSQVLAAMDTRIRAVVLSGYFTTFPQTSWHGHCICHHPLGIGRVCDMPDLSALIAPRPQFIESGIYDRYYPFQPAYDMVHKAYTLLNAEDQLDYHRYRGGHRFEGVRSIPWLMEQLEDGRT